MRTTISKTTTILAAIGIGLTTLTLPTTAAAGVVAPAKTYKACVNKKTGAMKLVKNSKKCKKTEKTIKWNNKGPAGATGPAGPAGAVGAAGAYNAVDQTGKTVGTLVGLYAGVYPMVRLDSGAVLIWDNDPNNDKPLSIASPVIYYQQPGCAGDGYSMFSPGLLFDLGIVIGSPASPGNPVYKLQPGTPQTFTAQSMLTPAGCAATASAISGAYVAKEAGTVPSVKQPLYLAAKQ